MYKVLIADDEVKVCKLIQNLVDWKSLGLEIVGIANDGIVAFELIKEKKPDIVITDIRMPGYDGIELIRRAKELNININFIIVSGYRHFDYAHNAIKYGVEDYLLKPLKQTEIIGTLTKMLEKRNMMDEEHSINVDLKRIISIDTKKMRKNLLEILLNDSKAVDVIGDREDINREYHCKFVEGYYQAAIIKPDIFVDEENERAYELLLIKTQEIAEKHLKESFNEVLLMTIEEGILALVNGNSEELQSFKRQLKKIRNDIISFRDVFLNVKVTCGIGEIVTDVQKLRGAIYNARRAVMNRLVQGRGHIIEYAEIEGSGLLVNDVVNYSFRESLLSYIDTLDSESIREMILDIKARITKARDINGYWILRVCHEIEEIFYFGIKRHLQSSLEYEGQKHYAYRFHRCSTIDEVFDQLIKVFESSIHSIKEEKKKIDTQPIRIAKRYIKAHYNFPLTLEEVSHEAGFNAAYFSSLFKKETGQNFSEYLIEIRIRAAKQLLADTNKSILDVAEEVGYNDLKHFSKLFKKITGLSPSEYRKLYY